MSVKVRYYDSFTDDFEQTANQKYELPDSYKWVKTDIISKILSIILLNNIYYGNNI